MNEDVLKIIGAEFLPAHTRTIVEDRAVFEVPSMWHLKHLDVCIDEPPLENPGMQAWAIAEIKHWLRGLGFDYFGSDFGVEGCEAHLERANSEGMEDMRSGIHPTELEAWCALAMKVQENK